MAIFNRRRRPLSDQEQISLVAKAIRGGLPTGAQPGSVQTIDTAEMMRNAANQLAETVKMTPDAIEQALINEGMESVVPFTPGRPLNPFYAYGGRPRTFNYSVGRNISTRPRQYRTNFETLRNLIEKYDVAQICIRHIIDDLRSMPLQFNPIEGMSDDVSEEIKLAKKFWASPDGDHDWPEWLGLWLQDILRYDGGCLYKRRDLNGKVIALDVVDTTTIAPLIDFFGRRPSNGAPAYLQFVQGLPWDWLTRDDIVYTRFNPIPEDVYGVSPIEMVMLNANIDMRFQWFFLQYFTEGTVPDGFMEAPPDQSSVDQVAEWQETWEAWLAGDQGQKHKIRWIPAGSRYQQSKDTHFDREFPQYLLRRTIAAYGLVPNDLGFTEDVNRSTGDTQMDVQFRISTAPKTITLQHIMNRVTQEDLGLRVKVSFDSGREKEDRLMEAQAHQLYVAMGAESPDEVRRDILGYEVNPAEMTPRGIISQRLGFIPLRWAVGVSGDVDAATGAPMPGTVESIEYVMPGTPGPDPASKLVEQTNLVSDTAGAEINTTNPEPTIEDNSDDTAFAKSETYTPPKAVQEEAKRALEWISQKEHGDNFTSVGRKRASDLARGATVSRETIGRIANYLARHEVDKKGKGFSPGEEGYPSPGRVAWAAWGGDPAKSWVDGILKEDEKVSKNIDHLVSLYGPELDLQRTSEILKQWRRHAKNQVAKGRKIRRFEDEDLPEEVSDYVWLVLSKATTKEDVDRAFSADRSN